MGPLDLDDFCAAVAHVCSSTLGSRTRWTGLIMADEEDGVMVGRLADAADVSALSAVADQVLAGHHNYAAMASLTRWSPDDATPFADSWLVVMVHRDEAARFCVNSPAGSNEWFELNPLHAPIAALSTAGALRKALDGEPLTMRMVDDNRLFNKITDGDPPPTRADGKL